MIKDAKESTKYNPSGMIFLCTCSSKQQGNATSTCFGMQLYSTLRPCKNIIITGHCNHFGSRRHYYHFGNKCNYAKVDKSTVGQCASKQYLNEFKTKEANVTTASIEKLYL